MHCCLKRYINLGEYVVMRQHYSTLRGIKVIRLLAQLIERFEINSSRGRRFESCIVYEVVKGKFLTKKSFQVLINLYLRLVSWETNLNFGMWWNGRHDRLRICCEVTVACGFESHYLNKKIKLYLENTNKVCIFAKLKEIIK